MNFSKTTYSIWWERLIKFSSPTKAEPFCFTCMETDSSIFFVNPFSPIVAKTKRYQTAQNSKNQSGTNGWSDNQPTDLPTSIISSALLSRELPVSSGSFIAYHDPKIHLTEETFVHVSFSFIHIISGTLWCNSLALLFRRYIKDRLYFRPHHV